MSARQLTNYSLVLILLTAFFLRFHRLTEVPPGMTHDEASIGFFVKQIANRTSFVIDAPYGYANEPFTKYSASLLMYGIGQTEWALRAHQALWGVLLVVFTFKWGKAAFSREVGIAAAALVAVSFWATMTSRFALNSNPTPALFTAGMWFMWIGLFKENVKRRRLAWLGFALMLAGALMTYEASRGAWLALPMFAVYLLIFDRRRIWQFLLALTLGTGLALPHLLNPAAWGRTNTLAIPLNAALQGNLEPLSKNFTEAFGTLFIKGDPFVVYNIPDRPVLDWATGALFVLGLAICIWRWRQPAYAFAVLWFGTGFAPAAAIGSFTMMLHAITTQAVVMVFPVLAFEALRRFLPSKYVSGALALLFVVTAAITYNDYFYKWGSAIDTRSAYFANFRGVTDFLRQTPYKGSVTLSSPFPGLPHDPLVVDMRVFRDDLDLRWFDAREAFIFPPTNDSLLILPVNTPPDPFFAARLPMNQAQRHVVRADDKDPHFDALRWDPQTTLAALLNDKSVTRLSSPLNFGDAVELIGFSLSATTAKGGDTLKVIAFWRILDPSQLGQRDISNYAVEANIFLHLVDAQNSYVAGNDRLQVPAWNWHAGDVFAQIHRLQVPLESRGEYSLLMGIYTLPDLSRLSAGEVNETLLSIIQITK